jgi:hypothetical protein
MIMVPAPAQENQSPHEGGALIISAMFRFAATLTLATASALAAAQAQAQAKAATAAQTQPGGERG